MPASSKRSVAAPVDAAELQATLQDAAQATTVEGMIVLGWCEWLALPALDIASLQAKVDTGARSSALHVESQEDFRRDGIDWVRFSVHPAGRGDSRLRSCESRVIDRRRVTDSGGRESERVFILTPVALAGQCWDIEVNLCNRRNLRFPMLLGRTALAGRFLVDAGSRERLGPASSAL